MTVKTIFKTLIGTVVVIVISCLTIELLNFYLMQFQLTNLSKISVEKAADLFSQETYKSDDSSRRSCRLRNITFGNGVSDTGQAYNGGEYLSGDIYGVNTAGDYSREVWNKIYTDHSFELFIDRILADNADWDSAKTFKIMCQGTSVPSSPEWDASESELENYVRIAKANSYREDLYTTLNVGIPYIGLTDTNSNAKDIFEKIFRWNLTTLLCNGNYENINMDRDGRMYVNYNGFRCYAREARITNISYKIYDLSNISDRQQFLRDTNIDATKLGISMNSSDERRFICVAGITYSMQVSYKGVSPIANVFNYVWDNEVDGFEGNGRGTSYKEHWNENTSTLSGGGIQGDNTLPTSGNVMYYIIR